MVALKREHGFDHRRIDFGRATFAGGVVDAGTSGLGIDHCAHCFPLHWRAIYSEIFRTFKVMPAGLMSV